MPGYPSATMLTSTFLSKHAICKPFAMPSPTIMVTNLAKCSYTGVESHHYHHPKAEGVHLRIWEALCLLLT